MATATNVSVWAEGAVSIKDAAKLLAIGLTRFRQLAKANGFPRKYQGDKPVYAKAVLVAFLESLPDAPPTVRVVAQRRV